MNLLNKLDKLWAIGKETYVRFYPNPGFRIVYADGKKEIKWSKFYGWHHGRVR